MSKIITMRGPHIGIDMGVLDGDLISAIEQKIALDGTCVIFIPKDESEPKVTLTYNNGVQCREDYEQFVRVWEGRE